MDLGFDHEEAPGEHDLISRRRPHGLPRNPSVDRRVVPRSRLGLEAEQTILEKLGLFLATVLLGPLIGLLLFLGVDRLDQPWHEVGRYFLETVALFWGCSLVFIWWRPAWFRKIYLAAERKAILAVRIVAGIAAVVLGVCVLIGFLQSMHVF